MNIIVTKNLFVNHMRRVNTCCIFKVMPRSSNFEHKNEVRPQWLYGTFRGCSAFDTAPTFHGPLNPSHDSIHLRLPRWQHILGIFLHRSPSGIYFSEGVGASLKVGLFALLTLCRFVKVIKTLCLNTKMLCVFCVVQHCFL